MSNPYASSQHYDQPVSMPSTKVPTYCTVMFIINLILGFFRMLIVLLGFLGIMMNSQTGAISPELMGSAYFEVFTGIAIVVFCFGANSLLLMKQRFGLILGYLLIASVLASIAVGFWQAAIMQGQFSAGSPERIGFWVGAVVVAGIRLGLLGMYAVALYLYHAWDAKQKPPQWF